MAMAENSTEACREYSEGTVYPDDPNGLYYENAQPHPGTEALEMEDQIPATRTRATSRRPPYVNRAASVASSAGSSIFLPVCEHSHAPRHHQTKSIEPRESRNYRIGESSSRDDAIRTLAEKVSRFLERYGIRRRLEEAFENQDYNGEDFITSIALSEIWTSDRLGQFLRIVEIPNVDKIAPHIRQHNLQILSILVAVGFRHWERLPNILEQHQDDCIPFSYEDLKDNSFLGSDSYDYFNRIQESYHPVVIQEGEIQEHPSSRRLPFIRKESKYLGEGSYGKVTKEVVAIGQFKYNKSQTRNMEQTVAVARKRFRARPDYEMEARNLRTLNQIFPSHDHIVQYLAMLVVGDGGLKDFSILLPCADMDLKKLLYLDDPVDFSVTDLIKALCGVADAIRWLHDDNHIEGQPEKLTCCHMDLKLDNVLVYEWERRRQNELPVGVWKISDFGISTWEEAPQRAPSLRGLRAPVDSLKALTSNTPRTIHIQGKRRSPACQAPEFNLPGGKIGRSSDVWSFGCILFQVLARGVGPGKSEMLKLDRLRCLELDEVTEHPTDYFYRVENGTRSLYLNPHVKKWLTSKGGFDSYPVRCCKELIFQMLDLDPEKRPKSKLVIKKLSHIAHKPGNDPTPEPRQESSVVNPLPDETLLDPAVVAKLVFKLDTPATTGKEPETPRPCNVGPAPIPTNPPPDSAPTTVHLPT